MRLSINDFLLILILVFLFGYTFSQPDTLLQGGDPDRPLTYPAVLDFESSQAVTYLSFTAIKINGHDVRVDWVTSKEVNNGHFIIEKRLGSSEFKPLISFLGAGTSIDTNSYSFTDESGMASYNYYRLKQVGMDGQIFFSKEVEINYASGREKFLLIPNPAKDSTFLYSTANLYSDYQFFLVDLEGFEYKKGIFLKGSEGGKVKISLKDLNTGVYYIKLVAESGKSYIVKLLKV